MVDFAYVRVLVDLMCKGGRDPPGVENLGGQNAPRKKFAKTRISACIRGENARRGLKMSGEGADCPPPEIYAGPDRSTAAGGRASEASIAAAPAGRPTPITQSVEELLEQRSVSGVAEVIPILRFFSPIS